MFIRQEDYNMKQVKRKCGRPPKQKTKLDITQMPAENNILYDLN